jgi:hypothetical protein
MRKVLLCLLTLMLLSFVSNQIFAFGEIPQTRLHNDKCLGVHQMKVLQVLDDGILANLCPSEYPSYYKDCFDAARSEGEIVYMPVNPKYNDYVDDQKITLPNTQCFCKDGTFKYTTNGGVEKTVRKIKIVSSAAPGSTK